MPGRSALFQFSSKSTYCPTNWCWRNICRGDPLNVDSVIALAQHYADQQQYEACDDLLAPMLENPDVTTLQLFDMAEILEEIGYGRNARRYARSAVKFYEAILARDPLNVPARLWMSQSINAAGDPEEAIRQTELCIEQSPDARTYTYLGALLEHLGRLDGACKAIEQALEKDPDHDDANNLMGLLLKDADPDRACTYFLRAIATSPDHVEALQNLALIRGRQERWQESAQLLTQAFQFEPSDYWIVLKLGNALWGAGDIEAARRCYQHALDLSGNDAFVQEKLEEFEAAQRTPDQ